MDSAGRNPGLKLVVNIRRARCDIYVGRGSKWGNPFSHLTGGMTRREAIESYEAWLKDQPELMAALPELRGKVLGCYCKPDPCHGDVLARLANERNMENDLIDVCARAAHEANRSLCIALGDYSQKPWEEAPDWQKASARDGVIGVLQQNTTPEQSHQRWMERKLAEGWRYGTTKDVDKKEHDCLVSYADLPPHQRLKDDLFISTVKLVARAYEMRPQ